MTKIGLLSAALLAACTTSESSSGPLQLDVEDRDRVHGTYEIDGVAIEFDIERTDQFHRTSLLTADGRELITTKLEGTLQTTSVLDGKLVASGMPNAPNPTIVGDEAAMEELSVLPEATLLESLPDALLAHGVDESLLRPKLPEVSSVSDAYNGYFWFEPGGTNRWLSAAGAWPTYVYLRTFNDDSCSAIMLLEANDQLVAPPNSWRYRTKYMWGGFLTIVNSPAYASWPGGWVCRPHLVQVRVSPYTWSP